MATRQKRLLTNWCPKVLLVLCVVLYKCRGEFTGCTSNPGAAAKPNDPVVPDLPDSFQTKIEANIIDQKYSISGMEIVDNANNRAVLALYRKGVKSAIYFDYANNQQFSVADGMCAVDNITGNPDSVIFGGHSANVGIPHVYSTAGVLHFAKKFGEVYKGPGTVRGLPAYHWQSCMYWATVKSNFTLDYYFLDPTWNNSDTTHAIPLRAEVVGSQVQDNAQSQQFHHIYDFIDFRTTIPTDSSVFETPKGIACPGRKKTQSVPKLKNSYYYREEVVDTTSNIIWEADIWYDYDWKMVRYDRRSQTTAAPYYSLDPITEIHDFNTGVAYVIDKFIRNCTILPIENATTWDSVINGSTKYIYMRNPQYVFYLDGNYEYSGTRTARNILCDVYTSIRPDFNGLPNVFEIYFMSPLWSSSNNRGLNTDNPSIPIRLTVTTQDALDYPTVYEFHDFDQEAPDIRTAFDVSTCYSDQDKIDFKITFPSTAGEVLKIYRTIFIDQTIALIASLAGTLSPLRITHSEIHWDDTNVYFLATILEKAPAIAKYRKNEGKFYQHQNDMTLNGITEASQCADECDSADSFTCNSFDFCGGKQICSLSKDYAADGDKLGDSIECDHYSRVLSGRVDQEIVLADAWIVLTDQVVKGTFQFKFTLPDNTVVTFKASDITDNVLRNANRQASKTSLQHFTGRANKEVKGFDDLILTGESINDCANECLDEIVFTCQSFEYCYDTGYCIMSRQHPDERPDLIITSDHCDLYTREYVAKFSETPGQTVLSSSDTIYQNIYTDNQCAKLCVDLTEFECKSFDYCHNINACFLGRKHVFDVPKSEINKDVTCSHYSRNYADDFKMTDNKVIALKDNRVIQGVSAEQCAKMCVDEESFSCASFDYCGNMTECRLSDAATSDVGQVTIESSSYCSVYQRMYFPNGQRYSKPVSSGYSSSAMGGLGFAMLIIGAVLAIAGYFAIGKWRGKSFDSMTISFKNMDNSDD